VQRWGNSLAVRIPRSYAIQAELAHGCEVEVSVEDGRLMITPIPAPAFSLEGLLSGVHPDNLPGELDTGPPVGGEVW
jgi:antitoxin MazE